MQNPIIRDVITPGTTNSVEKIIENAFPIFSFPNEGFTFRYMRFWIESAYQKTGQIMPEELIQGLNETDRFFSSSQNHLQFRLERGDILLLNNRFICHNRTAFENNTASFDNHRRLVRSWINYQ
jgi:isocitrate/isopropylmalate dehydrogenase